MSRLFRVAKFESSHCMHDAFHLLTAMRYFSSINETGWSVGPNLLQPFLFKFLSDSESEWFCRLAVT